MANDIYNDHPVGVGATKALIAKIKKGDADNAAEIARVEANGLKIAPPEHEGVGTMLFYTGTLI